ncbi:uncharacterized protein FIESC28_05408 [Fusarium coffeatum]|uniref:Apple domain-containing protein n=1 Tax=Fusarium coffeatum TaxID=231269 RepID=A0A366RSR3_9HYPO|nr:uncharacterized protein FIESC28_05408 [Fusarium coffeatum]RBR20129.1 hypothetical protein FIESC28_05408 [Fusarium coffeatum]
MVRPLVHSFVIAAVLSSLVNAGPCRPSSSSVAVTLTTTESSVATGSATTQTKESSSTEEPSGAPTETSLTSSEQSTTTDSALSTVIATTTSESHSSTDTTLDTTTTTGCPVPEPPVYDDPFTATHAEEAPQTTIEVVDLVPRGRARRDARNLLARAATSSAEPIEEDVTTTTEDAIATTETTAATTSEETTATTEEANTTTQDVTTTTEDATATTESAAATTSEAVSGCVNNLQKPSPEGSVCGKKGYVSSNSADWRYLGQGSSSSLLDCYTSCMQQSNCVTFYYEKNMQCTLWRGTITELSTDETSFKSYETSCFCDTDIEPAPTCSYDNSINFNDGKFAPWQADPNPGGKDPVAFKVVPNSEGGSPYRFQTGQFDFDKGMWIYQDVKACAGTTFYCTYRWKWDQYYEIPQKRGRPLVPYVRVYQGDDMIGNRFPESADETNIWTNARFSFTMPESGETTIWFVASSPQGEWINTSDDDCKPEWVHRPNSFALDSVQCYSS